MADHVVLRLPPGLVGVPDATELTWITTDARGVPTGPVTRGPWSEAAAACASQRLIVVVPGTDALLAMPHIPARGAAKVAKLVPFALEDQLAADLDSLHFAIGRAGADQRVPVAVVDRTRLSAWIELLRGLALEPVALYVDADLVPENPTQAVLILEGDRLVVRRPGEMPMTLDAVPLEAALALAGFEPGATTPDHVLFYVDGRDWQRHEDAIERLRAQVGSLTVQRLPDGVLPLLAPRAVAASPINLLQGSYAEHARRPDAWMRYRVPALLASIFLGLHILTIGLSGWRAHREEVAVDQDLARLAAAAFPGGAAAAQGAGLRLAVESRVNASRAAVSEGLVGALGLVAESVRGTDAMVESARLQDGVITLTLEVANSGVLDRIRSAASARGWTAELQASTPREQRLKATLALREGRPR
jgi:general secretion pathway protein L